jgi:hypothetical protein
MEAMRAISKSGSVFEVVVVESDVSDGEPFSSWTDYSMWRSEFNITSISS